MKRPGISRPLWLTAALVVPPMLAGCGMTSTYGTGQAPEVAMFREMTGGLLNKNEKKEPIEFQPRAPLVMPPSATSGASQLPPPVETASAAAPDWPMDPSERIGPTADGPLTAHNLQVEYRRLRPLAGVFPEQTQPQQPTYDEDSGKTEYYNNIVNSRRQREEFKQALADSKGYGSRGGERRYLTDPPLDYREPVATTSTPDQIPPKKKKNFLARWFTGG